MSQPVLMSRHEATALITLNIPQRLNALDATALERLVAAVEDAVADPTVTAVVITGGENAFCSGEDLTAAGSMTQEQFGAQASDFQNLARALLSTDKPTIAAIAGAAIGGGLEIALNCDVRIASSNSRFACPEASWGMTVSNASSLLLRRCVGEGWARDMMIFGLELDAERALQMGLVTRTCPEGEVVQTAIELAAQVAKAPVSGLAYAKMLLRQAAPGVPEALRVEEKALVESFGTVESRERVAGFATRRRADRMA